MRSTMLFLYIVCFAAPIAAQRSDRDSALFLRQIGKRTEATPLLERIVAAHAADYWVDETLGFDLFESAAALPDAAARKAQRARARELMVKALTLGSTSEQVRMIVATLPADGGSDPVYSSGAEVDGVMRRAESEFSAHDYRAALGDYQKALVLDSMQYSAALYSGDAYLSLEKVDSAYIWYGRATVINPDRETGWRFWSDVLLKHQRLDDARDKAIAAIVAEPFNRITRQVLNEWLRVAHATAIAPQVHFPIRDTATVRSPERMAYDSVHRLWQGTDGRMTSHFSETYPAEKTYRHSIAEELEGLRAVYRVSSDTVVANLRVLDNIGLLESFIFFTRADAGIAADYSTYRRNHRDELRRYWADLVIAAAAKAQ